MSKTALIVGGTGQIGRAAARRLLDGGWRVRLAHRGATGVPPDLEPRVESLILDRDTPGALAAALAGGVDALIDTVAFNDAHAHQLLEVQADVGAFVVISTGSVCRDHEGRTLDEARQTGFPHFPVPITEDQPTVAPGPGAYSTRKAALEETLLQRATTPVAILRPYAVHGEGSGHSREWWFVRRILDGRRRIPLAWRGESRFHTTATVNLAELIAVTLEAPATRILNAADPEALTVAGIGRAIAAVYGVELEFALLGGAPEGGVGATPWSGPLPLVADMSRAAALGYRPVATYAEAVGAACRSAEQRAAAGGEFAPYLRGMFDYAAEDAWLASSAS